MLVWGWGVMVLGGLGTGIGNLFKFIGYETGYSNIKTLNNATAMAAIKSAMGEDAIMETSVLLSLYMQGENWMWANGTPPPRKIRRPNSRSSWLRSRNGTPRRWPRWKAR